MVTISVPACCTRALECGEGRDADIRGGELTKVEWRVQDGRTMIKRRRRRRRRRKVYSRLTQ
jgi:hypothetical protein